MKRVLLTGAAGDIGGRLRKLLKPVYPELRLSDIKKPADLQARRALRRRRPRPHRGGREGRRRHRGHHPSRAATPSKGRGRRSCSPTSSAATICSRRRGARASSAWCSPPPTMPSASTRAIHHIGVDVTVRPDFALWRQQGVRRGAGLALCRQARPARAVPQDRQRRRQAARQAPAVDLDLARRTWPSWCASASSTPTCASRSSTAPPDNERAWWDNQPRPRLRLPPDRPRRGPSRARVRRAGQADAGPGRRLLPGRHLLQRGVRRRRRAACGSEPRADMRTARASCSRTRPTCAATTTARAPWRACRRWARSSCTRGPSRSTRRR